LERFYSTCAGGSGRTFANIRMVVRRRMGKQWPNSLENVCSKTQGLSEKTFNYQSQGGLGGRDRGGRNREKHTEICLVFAGDWGPLIFSKKKRVMVKKSVKLGGRGNWGSVLRKLTEGKKGPSQGPELRKTPNMKEETTVTEPPDIGGLGAGGKEVVRQKRRKASGGGGTC